MDSVSHKACSVSQAIWMVMRKICVRYSTDEYKPLRPDLVPLCVISVRHLGIVPDSKVSLSPVFTILCFHCILY